MILRQCGTNEFAPPKNWHEKRDLLLAHLLKFICLIFKTAVTLLAAVFSFVCKFLNMNC